MKLFYLAIFTISLIAGQDLEGRYIVLLEDEEDRTTFENKVAQIKYLVEDDNRSVGDRSEITSNFEFINAVGAKLNSAAIEELLEDPMVQQIVPVTRKWASAVQNNATWGLSRISSKSKKRSTPYSYKYNDEFSGEGMSVYVIDTGINVSHKEFEGRASFGTVTVEGSSKEDKHGHGTHCAGTIAGKTYGVAKKANVIAVKVLGDDGYGDDEGVIKGIQWAVKHAKTKGKKAILSMSLGGDASDAVDKAVVSAYKAGAVVIVAAGNDNDDACEQSPAKAKNMVTVGSIDVENKKSSFSNYGKCINILAPGSKILSTWIGNNTATNTISGTSMATPHVAGQVAILWSGSKSSSNKEIISKLYSMALRNQTTGWDGDTVNRLLYNGQ